MVQDPQKELHESIKILAEVTAGLAERHHLNSFQIDHLRDRMEEACRRLEGIERAINPLVQAHEQSSRLDAAKADLYEAEQTRLKILADEKVKLFSGIRNLLSHPWALPLLIAILLYATNRLGIDAEFLVDMVQPSVVQENAGSEIVWHHGGRR